MRVKWQLFRCFESGDIRGEQFWAERYQPEVTVLLDSAPSWLLLLALHVNALFATMMPFDVLLSVGVVRIGDASAREIRERATCDNNVRLQKVG